MVFDHCDVLSSIEVCCCSRKLHDLCSPRFVSKRRLEAIRRLKSLRKRKTKCCLYDEAVLCEVKRVDPDIEEKWSGLSPSEKLHWRDAVIKVIDCKSRALLRYIDSEGLKDALDR